MKNLRNDLVRLRNLSSEKMGNLRNSPVLEKPIVSYIPILSVTCSSHVFTNPKLSISYHIIRKKNGIFHELFANPLRNLPRNRRVKVGLVLLKKTPSIIYVCFAKMHSMIFLFLKIT